jgi:hypothetical protein
VDEQEHGGQPGATTNSFIMDACGKLFRWIFLHFSTTILQGLLGCGFCGETWGETSTSAVGQGAEKEEN